MISLTGTHFLQNIRPTKCKIFNNLTLISFKKDLRGAAYLAPHDPLHLLIRRNWCASQVWVGVANAFGTGQVQTAWPRCCP